MAGGLGLLGVSVAPSPGAEALPDTKAVFSALYSQTSHVTPERSELGHSCVFQGEAAALSDAEHGLGRPVSAGHPAGHLCLRVSAALPGPAPVVTGWVGGHLPGLAPLVSEWRGGGSMGEGHQASPPPSWRRLARRGCPGRLCGSCGRCPCSICSYACTSSPAWSSFQKVCQGFVRDSQGWSLWTLVRGFLCCILGPRFSPC